MRNRSRLPLPVSTTMRRGLSIVGIIAAVALFALIPLTAYPPSDVREIVLVARNMTFYLEGSDAPNPTLRLKPGEVVRIIVRNEEPGIVHDFAVTSLQASTEATRWGAAGSVSFRAPDRSGRYEYMCTPHSRMMKGVILVAE